MTWACKIGEVYLNQGQSVARYILEDAGGIVYFDFIWPLDNFSNIFSIKKCTRPSFQRWAKFKLTPADIAGMKIPLDVIKQHVLEVHDQDRKNRIETYVRLASTELLEQELANRKTQPQQKETQMHCDSNEIQTRMTWQNIRDAIENGVPNSRLDEPAQFVLAPIDGDVPAPTMPALTFAKSKDLFDSEDDPGIRSHYDNQDHPGDYLILLDENPYDDQGRTVLSMEEVEEELNREQKM